MRQIHFNRLRPVCPVCRLRSREILPLELAVVVDEEEGDIVEGILRCTNALCLHEYPIIDGIPIIVTQLRELVSGWIDRIRARGRFSEPIESLLGDCCGPGSSYDDERQRRSSYVWDHWGEFDESEPVDEPEPVQPGAIARLLRSGFRLLPSDAVVDGAPLLDVGCAAGRTAFELAKRTDDIVLGVDLDISMLRLAREIRDTGRVDYPRRRVGIVYDRQQFTLPTEVVEQTQKQVDFWCCDATSLPFNDSMFAFISSLNVIDCVHSPIDALHEFSRVLVRGGGGIIASPYDWSIAATPITSWIGGHSQRGELRGAAEGIMRAILGRGEHSQAVRGLQLIGEAGHSPWQVRLHQRSVIHYDCHLIAVEAVENRL